MTTAAAVCIAWIALVAIIIVEHRVCDEERQGEEYQS